MTYQDAIGWMTIEYDFDEFKDFEEFIGAVREEFENDSLIDSIEDQLQLNFEDTIRP